MQASLFKNPKNFNTAGTGHKNPAWGSSECGGSEPLYTPYADKANPATKRTAVTNVENSLDFGRIAQLLHLKKNDIDEDDASKNQLEKL